ncbi:hypothetical protein P170DRAFT_43302 [Aspergillus steynii IBT 23096]|uniref:Zn(2)-C6 fungal-type domain-containing protein n=1 Tax=Aspergillus steynii IBT 23096 TaxID=1392250 RepID=A0A2I2GRP4_9EURO|nr:uncharacterized protein P170DRAFT_43302 [Aspergillus steynii IBT 23096]PLB55534.1 hypothetical protein P170DRAFT_43302 [Aspergillus steynii IBT 23096]
MFRQHLLTDQEKRAVACDLCYSKKIKCDREIECQNCIQANVQCIRSRPRRIRGTGPSPRTLAKAPRVPKQLQNTIGEDGSGQYSCFPVNKFPSERPRTLTPEEASKEKETQTDTSLARVSGAESSFHPLIVPEHNTANQNVGTDSTSNLIRQEIVTNAHLSLDRVRVLESALGLVGRFVTASQLVETTQHEQAVDSDPSPPEKLRPELFFMLLKDQRSDNGAKDDGGPLVHWPDHISPKTLERMCLALLSGAVCGNLALQYSLCVLCKATVYVSRWLRFCTPGALSDSLEKSKQSYIENSLRCMKASLVHLLGQTSRSWFLTSLASRTFVALGYHRLSPSVLESDDSSEIRHCTYWCYYMDKTLSMLLVRPSSLPTLRPDPASLVYTRISDPLSCKVKVLVRLARVQDLYLDIVIQGRKAEEPCSIELVNSLQLELNSIRLSIMQFRPRYIDIPSLDFEWDALDFTFFSIATTVLRLNYMTLHDHAKREECVQCARKALLSMRACQTHISTTSKINTDFLFWTILLYPLTPFFVIFCNVVATSNMQDLELLKEATATISSIRDQCSFSINLQNLLSHLIGLCSNLHDVHRRQSSFQRSNGNISWMGDIGFSPHSSRRLPADASAGNDRAEATVHGGQFPTPSASTNIPVDGHSPNTVQGSCEPGESSIWDDGLMSELFNIQPSVDWFGLEHGDVLGCLPP